MKDQAPEKMRVSFDLDEVLFVSEKMAALQVVYRRLQETHLADFCLPLHSYKANKKEILEQSSSTTSFIIFGTWIFSFLYLYMF